MNGVQVKSNDNVSKKKCFIITPIGSENDPIRRHIDGVINAAIKPALGDEFEVNVAHEMPRIGSITRQIIEEIYKSDLVIANLTHNNPNVMYELAFRHCLGKPVIQIMEYGTKLPFDIENERTISYKNDAQGTIELCQILIKYINEIDYSNNFQGPIYDYLISIYNTEKILSNISNVPSISVENDAIKYLINEVIKLGDEVKNITKENRLSNMNNSYTEDVTNEIWYIRISGFDKLSMLDKQSITEAVLCKLWDDYITHDIAYYDEGGIEFETSKPRKFIEKYSTKLESILDTKNLKILDIVRKRHNIISIPVLLRDGLDLHNSIIYDTTE